METKGIKHFYGKKPVNLLVDPERAGLLKEVAMKLPDITLDEHHLCDLELLTTGVFSPLSGFMIRSDYESVLDRMRLQNDMLWPVPICLDIPESRGKSLETGQSAAIRDPEGFLLAIMEIEDIWPVEKEKEAKLLYGTTDTDHPGVYHLFNNTGEFYVGGKLEVLSLPLHFDFKQLRMTPVEVRNLYKKLGWQRVVGFQTRNVIHRPQFEITLSAMQRAKANLLLLPSVGMTLHADFNYYTRVRCYREIIKHYPPESAVLNLLPHYLKMTGPRDALMHMIMVKNFGCTHFVIGHGHASPRKKGNGDLYYTDENLMKTVHALEEEIGVRVVDFKKMIYLPFEDEHKTIDGVPDGTQSFSLTGNDIMERVKTGRKIPDWASFPEVVEELQTACPPPRKQGLTVFLTGLSGAGKSTIARVLYSKFLEIGDRPVTLLDGDIVRRNLSSELSFSKEHRDINVRRIGFVAEEITKNRGIAICAPIAPYAATRREIRRCIQAHGGFVVVHVATPIEECERRDRKGMYAKARAGLIKGYTGVDDPYEIPEFPELKIDTSNITPDEAAQEVLIYLGQKGFI